MLVHKAGKTVWLCDHLRKVNASTIVPSIVLKITKPKKTVIYQFYVDTFFKGAGIDEK